MAGGDLSGLDREEGAAAVVPTESGECQNLEPNPGETPGVENQTENEAVTTEVVGEVGGNNAPEARRRADPGGPFEFSREEIAAAVAWGRQRTEAILRQGEKTALTGDPENGVGRLTQMQDEAIASVKPQVPGEASASQQP